MGKNVYMEIFYFIYEKMKENHLKRDCRFINVSYLGKKEALLGIAYAINGCYFRNHMLIVEKVT